ncbi:MAG: polysaccharide deacetylase family protein [candidate division Zixibacteria bacterium]
MTPEDKTIKNILSFEVEDRFHEDCPAEDNNSKRSRILPIIINLLDLLDEQKTKATFFILGCVAENFPEIIALIDARGHEIASHGYHHINIEKLSSEGISDELKSSKAQLEGILEKPVLGFKPPVPFSRKAIPDIIQIAAEIGYGYFAGPEIGTATSELNMPIPVGTKAGPKITIVPHTVLKGWGLTARFSEKLRIYPAWFIHRAIASLNRRGYSAIINLKLWELDHNQLRPPGSDYTSYYQYGNLNLTEQKLVRLLDIFEFTTFEKSLGMASPTAGPGAYPFD